jgi:DNA-binding Lrp family transcriptional regulator
MMRETGMDGYDLAILDALQHDGSLTNAALGERVHLSASQCSRRRAALEQAGLIRGYAARLDAQKLGLGLRAITRVNLRAHGQGHEDDFTRFLRAHPQVHAAFSVSGDADYVLDIRVRDLEAFAAFVHQDLLPHPQVAQVRSEIVLKTMKDGQALDLGRG